MRNNHDPLVPHQRRKAARETPDEAEQAHHEAEVLLPFKEGPVEAGPLPRVAGGALGEDPVDHGVPVAVQKNLHHLLGVPRGLPLAPKRLAASAKEGAPPGP